MHMVTLDNVDNHLKRTLAILLMQKPSRCPVCQDQVFGSSFGKSGKTLV